MREGKNTSLPRISNHKLFLKETALMSQFIVGLWSEKLQRKTRLHQGPQAGILDTKQLAKAKTEQKRT